MDLRRNAHNWFSNCARWRGYVRDTWFHRKFNPTDQAGKLRRSMINGLRQLVRVDEPDGNGNLGTTTSPVQPTNYSYDVFGNLKTVSQGIQTRSFLYSSLARLTSATNPENGTVTFDYDDTGICFTRRMREISLPRLFTTP